MRERERERDIEKSRENENDFEWKCHFFSLRVLPSWRVAEAAAASEISFTSQDSKIQSFQNYLAAGELEEEGEKKIRAPKRQKSWFLSNN